MKYTKGKAGPISRMQIEITMVHHFSEGTPQSRARGQGLARMAGGKIKGVTFLAQGRHHLALRERLVEGEAIDVTVRWTARDEVTVIETHDMAKAA